MRRPCVENRRVAVSSSWVAIRARSASVNAGASCLRMNRLVFCSQPTAVARPRTLQVIRDGELLIAAANDVTCVHTIEPFIVDLFAGDPPDEAQSRGYLRTRGVTEEVQS